MEVLFDFDTVARKPKIVSENLNEIRELFSVEDKAQAFIRRRMNRNIPVRKYAITNKGYFDIPFYEELYTQIQLKFPSVQLRASQSFLDNSKLEKISNSPIPLEGLVPRDYQLESATLALQKGRGVIVLPTSAGKTLVVSLIANTTLIEKDYNILILVPNIQLVTQTYKDLIEYGLEESLISKWTGNHEFKGTKIVIANNQILLSEKQDISVLNKFQCVIVDEVHSLATAANISKLVKSLKCKHIFGLTGSLPEGKFDIWTINRIFGSIIYQLKSIDLRKEHYISNVRVVSLEIEYKNVPEFERASMSNPTAEYEDETTWLQTNEYRNSIISKLNNRLETNTLILVDRIAHGEHLLEYLKLHTTKQVYFVRGSLEVEEREKIKQIMETDYNVVCIAISKIFSTGISIKNLHNIIFAAIGKARIKIIQSIGRSLRLHHTKEMATIFDIADVSLTYGFKHFEERKRLYESEKIPLITTKLVES